MPEMKKRKKTATKKEQQLGVTTLVSELSRAKLNLQIAVVGFIYFSVSSDHWKEDAMMKFNLNGFIK